MIALAFVIGFGLGMVAMAWWLDAAGDEDGLA